MTPISAYQKRSGNWREFSNVSNLYSSRWPLATGPYPGDSHCGSGAVSEAIAALLLLIPRTLKIGAIALILIFALAALVHILHGQYDIGNLIIYTAATWAVMTNSAS